MEVVAVVEAMTLQGGDVSAIVLATTFNALDHCMK
jgi:hypothetical protein